MEKHKIKIALLGLGTVGASVYRIVKEREKDIESKFGFQLEIKRILEKDKNRLKLLGDDIDKATDDIGLITDDGEIDIVVELIGGIEPARTFVLESLRKEKNIVTANKELIATHGEEIFTEADKRRLDLYFEASVGGGIPILKPLKESLAGNKISKILGIVNGTTNYILSRMEEDEQEFKNALKEAQEKGYAEVNPEADIEGKDAAAKIAILASIAFNSRVHLSDVYTEGISKITINDIVYARELGFVIKLLAVAKDLDDQIEVRVHPAFIPEDHPLAYVKDVYNAIFVEGDAVGEVMFSGRGAGGMAAGSSVVGDIIDIANNIRFQKTGKIGCTCICEKQIKNIEEINAKYYILMEALDKPGVLAKIAKAFGDNKVSLSSVIQREPVGKKADIVFMTHLTREKDVRKSLEEIEELDVISEIKNVIRVEVL